MTREFPVPDVLPLNRTHVRYLDGAVLVCCFDRLPPRKHSSLYLTIIGLTAAKHTSQWSQKDEFHHHSASCTSMNMCRDPRIECPGGGKNAPRHTRYVSKTSRKLITTRLHDADALALRIGERHHRVIVIAEFASLVAAPDEFSGRSYRAVGFSRRFSRTG
jgi:hypothetical protein